MVKLWKVEWTKHAALIVLLRDFSMDMFSGTVKSRGDQTIHLALWNFEKGIEIKKVGNLESINN
jgi:hypothetical protein